MAPHTVLHDITLRLGPGTLVYPGDAPFRRMEDSSVRDGDSYTLSSLAMSAHAGTHVDAPSHFFADGATLDEIDPTRWVSRALVVDTGDAPAILPEHVPVHALEPGLSVLFRTRNAAALAEGRFIEDFTALTLEAAQLLVDAGIGIAGIDYLSIERHDDGFPVHALLLGHGILIAENLDLLHVAPGYYTLVLAPLHVAGADGAPARALLLEE
ncbi:MAG: cyclase family protein [Ignavibacteria bacterium]|nr:cyclase family protein [Ignavibacteria bacterium]